MKKPIKQRSKHIAYHAIARLGPHRWPVRSPRLWILMYHRILPADDPRSRLEEPGMLVTPETFRRHLQWLQPEFELISLGEWVERRSLGRPLPRKACAITFDDGWRDNYEFAFPILKEFTAPATIFVVSHMIGTNQTFWPNRLARLMSHTRLCELTQPDFAWLRSRPAGSSAGEPTQEVIADAIRHAKQLSDHQMLALLDRAETLLSISFDGERSLLNWGEVLTMANSGLVEIGSHTATHTRLTDVLSPSKATREISGSQKKIEQMLGRQARLFCYPNGVISPTAQALVKKTYDAAVTTKEGINVLGSPPHLLRRIGIHEGGAWNSSGFFARLSGLF